MKNYLGAIGAVIILAIGSYFVFSSKTTDTLVGSVSQGGEYHATSTVGFGASVNISNSQGVLGSVVVTGTNTGTLWIYDATSTQATTSANLIAQFPASIVAGTYTFDTIFLNGLNIYHTGAWASTTITYR